ncbi:MAG: HAD hydrolase-like protein [Planctomycetota bacterium]
MRTIFFDIDGTLLFFPGIGRDAMARAMEEIWELRDPLAGVSFAGATDSGVARQIGGDRDPKAMWERYYAHLRADLSAAAREPLPGVTRLLDGLERRSVKPALMTGNLYEGARLKLESVRLFHRFDLARSGFAEDGIQRADLARSAFQKAGRGDAVVVGDSVADVECARAIGARVLIVDTGPQERSLLEAAQPDMLVDDLTDTDSILDWMTR